jgi:hypothetical protein
MSMSRVGGRSPPGRPGPPLPTGGMTPAHQTRPAGTMSSTDSGVGRYVTNPKRIRVFARFAHYDRSSLYDNHFRPTHLDNLG